MSYSKIYSMYRCSIPSFMSGLAKVFDIYGDCNKVTYSKSPGEADRRALQLDWEVIGLDIQKGIDDFNQKSKNKTGI